LFAFTVYLVAGDERSINKLANYVEMLVPEVETELTSSGSSVCSLTSGALVPSDVTVVGLVVAGICRGELE